MTLKSKAAVLEGNDTAALTDVRPTDHMTDVTILPNATATVSDLLVTKDPKK